MLAEECHAQTQLFVHLKIHNYSKIMFRIPIIFFCFVSLTCNIFTYKINKANIFFIFYKCSHKFLLNKTHFSPITKIFISLIQHISQQDGIFNHAMLSSSNQLLLGPLTNLATVCLKMAA